MKAKVLLVDDEKDIVRLIRYNLEKEGYEVLVAYDGTTALDMIWSRQPDVIVLDWMLPDTMGIDLCQQIKKELAEKKRIPVIMLTARAAERDRIAGFEAGADDYVTKPFSPRELVLRVKAMLGRHAEAESIQHIVLGPLSIEPQAYRVMLNNEELKLTPIEYRLLLSLVKHPDLVKSREKLLSDVWEDDATEVLDRTVDAHMKRLRAKLGSFRDCVETVRGLGYRLNTKAIQLLG
jgi:two-component system, OmpR family, phosphate regulon response regulator PhoB